MADKLTWKAWAVIDASGKHKPDGHGICPTRDWADLKCKAWKDTEKFGRSTHPGGKWKVVRVEVREVK